MGSTALWTLLVSVPIMLLAPFSPSGRAPYRFGRIWSWLVLKSNGVRLECLGREHIRKDRSYVFISNHVSHLDPPAVALCVPNTLRFVGKRSLARIPVFGLAARLARVIFIDRHDSSHSRESLNRCRADLHGGISALFFAEGTRSPDGRLQPFKKGGVILALQTGLPLVPVTVLGSRHLMPKGQRHIKPGTVRVVLDRPIAVAGFGFEDRSVLLERVHQVIQGHLEHEGRRPRGNRTDPIKTPSPRPSGRGHRIISG